MRATPTNMLTLAERLLHLNTRWDQCFVTLDRLLATLTINLRTLKEVTKKAKLSNLETTAGLPRLASPHWRSGFRTQNYVLKSQSDTCRRLHTSLSSWQWSICNIIANKSLQVFPYLKSQCPLSALLYLEHTTHIFTGYQSYWVLLL